MGGVIISIICLLDSTFNCIILNKGIITTVLFLGFHSNFKCKVPSPKKNPKIKRKEGEILFSGILILVPLGDQELVRGNLPPLGRLAISPFKVPEGTFQDPRKGTFFNKTGSKLRETNLS